MYRRNDRHDQQVNPIGFGVLLAGLTLVGLCWAWAFTGSTVQDYTDTGVGCVDDCLEIQDEAQTTESMTRN